MELLLLLRSTAPRAWTEQALTQELRASLSLVARTLNGFEKAGLVLKDVSAAYRYSPATRLLAEFADALDAHYKERPVAIINLIAAPPDRIQQLADAFRFRKEERR